MRYVGVVEIVLLLCGAIPVVSAQRLLQYAERAGADKAINLCSTCHGPRGVSTSPEFPILAGQREAYLIAQMKAFRDRTRADKEAHQFMWGIAAQLDDPTVEGIARYYSAQTPAPARPVNPELATKGEKLFHRGAPDRGIAACATCHGQNAEGDAERPRLAGQHAKYVAKQLRYMQIQEREPSAMRGTINNLTTEETEAVAAYAQSK
jgi:cytochrome c553